MPKTVESKLNETLNLQASSQTHDKQYSNFNGTLFALQIKKI